MPSVQQHRFLADREIFIQIDDNKLSAPVVLDLARLRMQPRGDLLTQLTQEFIDDDVVPVINRHLKHVGKTDARLYLPGEDAARSAERIVASVVTKPLFAELERFLTKDTPSGPTRKAYVLTPVQLVIRTLPDEAVPEYLTVTTAAPGPSSEKQAGKGASAGKVTPPVRMRPS
jgi:hypothetical protein